MINTTATDEQAKNKSIEEDNVIYATVDIDTPQMGGIPNNLIYKEKTKE